MLQRFLESKDAIIATLAIVNAPVDALTQEEWEVVEEESWNPLSRSLWRSVERGTVSSYYYIII